MKTFHHLSAVAAAFAVFAGFVYAEEAASTEASDVNVLTNDNFDAFVKEHPLVLAEFYAPWCGHCKALAPEYEDAATKLKEKDIHLAKVDCTAEEELCKKHEVQGYPTVKVFRGQDQVSPYTGQRKSDAIVSYMIKQSLPAVSIVDKDTIDDFKSADKVVLIAYIDSSDKASNETYTSVAEKHRDSYLFGATSDAALAKDAGVKAPALVLYKSFDEGKDIFEGKFDGEEIENFAKISSTPLIGEVGPETYSGYMEAGIPLAYLFVDTDESKEELSKYLTPLATKYKGKINFATIDAKTFGAHAQNLNLEMKWPAFAIQDTVKNQKFPYDQEKDITEKDIAKYVEEYLAGKIQPSIKSEPVPETQEGPVITVVAHNYEEVVNDSDKDVLVEFYAPWCGHCKNLAPKYEELAALYYNNPEYANKVVIAKVDATANDVPVDIAGFPTIKLYPAGAKENPIDYSGSRTVEDLATFVKENGKYKIDAYVEAKPVEDGDQQPLGKAAEAASEVIEEATEKVKEATEKAKGTASADDHDEL